MTVPFSVPTLLWASDIHLDHAFLDARTAFMEHIGRSAGAALIVTGDVSTATNLVAELEFVADGARRPVYFVLGNHDHYGSSVLAVRDAVVDLFVRRPEVQWLPPAGVVQLNETTSLVGVDGWADGRFGDPLATPLVLNDDRLIGEIAAQTGRAAKLAVKRALADADAVRLGVLLQRAGATATTIIVATHVPPFAEALPKRGRLAHPHWLPLLVCGATGAVLKKFAAAHPECEFLVLCGHTHAETDVMVAPNLRCMVMGARYGAVGVREIGGDAVSS